MSRKERIDFLKKRYNEQDEYIVEITEKLNQLLIPEERYNELYESAMDVWYKIHNELIELNYSENE